MPTDVGSGGSESQPGATMGGGKDVTGRHGHHSASHEIDENGLN